MSGVEFLAVAGCIAAMCSAYADGAELVTKIRERRRAQKALKNTAPQDDSTQSLELSLQTNRTIIQNQYNREIGRLGPVFEQGDWEARETLKDIIIHLQREVISNLKVACHKDTYVNFLPLQDVADGSGDRAIDCLRQLHDRLAPLRESYRPPARMAIAAPRGLLEHPHGFVEPSLSRDSTWETTKPILTSSAKRMESSEEGKKQRRMLPLFKRRPKSVEAVQQQQLNQAMDATSAFPEEFRAANVQKEQIYDPVSVLADLHIGPERDTNTSRLNSTSTTQSKTLEPDHPEFNAWADAESPHENHRNSEASSFSQVFLPTPESTDNRYVPGPHPLQKKQDSPPQEPYLSQRSTRDSHSSFGSATSPISTCTQSTSLTFQPFHPGSADNNITFTNISGTRALSLGSNGLPKCTSEQYFQHLQAQKAAPASNYQQHITNDGRSLMPGEHNNYAGFCQGAWRMQIGERKKAMGERQKPAALLTKTMSCWQCSTKKCHFEGKMVLKQGKKAIDMHVISSNGIFLRWSFLFKSHVHVNRDLEDPNMATFGCIFCCAEGRGTPTIGGLESFLQHLQVHRQKPPQGEVLYRINCIIMRNPKPGEDFDIVLA